MSTNPERALAAIHERDAHGRPLRPILAAMAWKSYRRGVYSAGSISASLIVGRDRDSWRGLVAGHFAGYHSKHDHDPAVLPHTIAAEMETAMVELFAACRAAEAAAICADGNPCTDSTEAAETDDGSEETKL